MSSGIVGQLHEAYGSVMLVHRPDAAYMFCPQAVPVLPNHKASDGLPRLSILVPTSESAGSAAGHGSSGVNALLQIDCVVTGTQRLPLPTIPPLRPRARPPAATPANATAAAA
jgi:hypothetical protein